MINELTGLHCIQYNWCNKNKKTCSKKNIGTDLSILTKLRSRNTPFALTNSILNTDCQDSGNEGSIYLKEVRIQSNTKKSLKLRKNVSYINKDEKDCLHIFFNTLINKYKELEFYVPNLTIDELVFQAVKIYGLNGIDFKSIHICAQQLGVVEYDACERLTFSVINITKNKNFNIYTGKPLHTIRGSYTTSDLNTIINITGLINRLQKKHILRCR